MRLAQRSIVSASVSVAFRHLIERINVRSHRGDSAQSKPPKGKQMCRPVNSGQKSATHPWGDFVLLGLSITDIAFIYKGLSYRRVVDAGERILHHKRQGI